MRQTSDEQTAIRGISASILTPTERDRALTDRRAALRTRQMEANQRDAAAWARVSSLEEWRAFAGERINALRRSLGPPVESSGAPETRVTSRVEADGDHIENLVYESRAGIWATANLYCPTVASRRGPAIVVVHSHHSAKTQGELQDMGVTWARAGCHVLVMDQFGYGERRYHEAGPRQDYRFRLMTGAQLHVFGDSLMGWMVHDIRRAVDFLVTRDGVDPTAIILMGAVAGGGDPAAVAAALDERISCAVPFNFGGPQPETPYPLPHDAEATFNYMGDASWESTRNLRLSARDGFLPWVIVASIAPRRLIYAHEFAWDREHDPVWTRLRRVYGFYDAEDQLAFAHGAGGLAGTPPEATHCNQIGIEHRRLIHHALERWYGITIPDETQERREGEELRCLTDETREQLRVRPGHEMIRELGSRRLATARREAGTVPPGERPARLRETWADLLGDVQAAPMRAIRTTAGDRLAGHDTQRGVLRTADGDILTQLTLTPRAGADSDRVVLCVAQEGARGFLTHRAHEIVCLLAHGIAVCLADLPLTGELQIDADRTWRGAATAMNATEWMLGDSLLAVRLRIMRGLCQRLRTTWPTVSVWGDSFAPTNAGDFHDPLIGEGVDPPLSEPQSGLLALLTALFDEGVNAVVAGGTLSGYAAILDAPHVYAPQDALVPGVLTAGDIPALLAALDGRRPLVYRAVDGRNRACDSSPPTANVADWIAASGSAPNTQG